MHRPLGIDELTEAWSWVLRLRDDEASAEDLAAWLKWYEADERNKQAFEEMQALWHGAGGLDEAVLNGDAPGTEFAARDMPSPSVRNTPARRVGWMTGSAIAAAAAAIVAVTLGLAEWRHGRHLAPSSSATAIVRETQLPDGSRIELASRSTVTAHYTESERVLDMQGTAGEAYFSVARNPARPFIVKLGKMRVRALGTAFNIRRADERAVVTVMEGLIEIYSPESAGERARIRLAAGQQVALNLAEESASRIVPVSPDHALAWQRGKLEYLNEPLAAVISDVNRYATRRVEVSDPEAGRILITGTVFTSDVDGWLEALPSIFPVRLAEGEDGTVQLTRRPH